MKRIASIFLAATLLMGAHQPGGEGTASPDGAAVYFITPMDGEQANGSVTIRFGLKGMGVAPAGTEREFTGHHHLLIDTGLPSLDEPIPNDANHRHFGGGQTEVTLTLPAGEHTLQLILGDWSHIPHNPPVYSEVITITVGDE
jgi:Domain of unknown function (DUF4399)